MITSAQAFDLAISNKKSPASRLLAEIFEDVAQAARQGLLECECLTTYDRMNANWDEMQRTLTGLGFDIHLHTHASGFSIVTLRWDHAGPILKLVKNDHDLKE